MIIPRDIFMMILGAIIQDVLIAGYYILFDYSKLKEQEIEEKASKNKGWAKRGYNNFIKYIKKRFFVRGKRNAKKK